MLNVVEKQNEFIEWITEQLPIPLYEEGVPDADTVRKTSDGKVISYAAIQPGLPQRLGSGRTFTGVRANDYQLPFQIQVISANASEARQIACGQLFNAALGYIRAYTGEMDQRPGGQLYSITTSNGATEAYQYATGFAFTLQLAEIP